MAPTRVVNIPEKEYILAQDSPAVFVGVADKKTSFTAVYRDLKTKLCYGKKFIVKQFILEKEYNYMEEGMDLQYLTTAEAGEVELQFVPKPKQKLTSMTFSFDQLRVKGCDFERDKNQLTSRQKSGVG